MSLENERAAAFGLGGSAGPWIGGALGGVIGATAFAAVLWVTDPAMIRDAVPTFYGFDPSPVTGLTLHLLHGALAGVVFAVIVSRPVVMGTLRSDAESGPLTGTGLVLRVVAAGFVYGLALWTILPLIVQPLWMASVGGNAAGAYTAIAVETLVGHLIFGLVLGIVYAVTVDLSDRPVREPSMT